MAFSKKKMTKGRKNALHPLRKEQNRNKEELDKPQNTKLNPIGSQPARLYGTTKVRKKVIPMRPVLSMPGSAYYGIGEQVKEWLSGVSECQINTSNQKIVDSLKNIQLDPDKELVSVDVV